MAETEFMLTDTQKERLQGFPILADAINEYIETNGSGEVPFKLPKFIYWFRGKIDVYYEGDPNYITGWSDVEPDVDEETGESFSIDWDEDFWSWGHNSRWSNTFSAWVRENFSEMVTSAIEIAVEHGDKYEHED